VPCDLRSCIDGNLGRTCAFYGDKLVFKICFDLLDAAEFVKGARYIFNTALACHRNSEQSLGKVSVWAHVIHKERMLLTWKGVVMAISVSLG